MEPQPAQQVNWYFVCTGNICRSAFAEGYLRAEAHRAGLPHFSTASGGTGINQALVPPLEIQELANKENFDLSGHTPEEINEEAIRSADIILTATTEHRAEILHLAPTALKRTFTLKEFGRLIQKHQPTLHTNQDAAQWWKSVARELSTYRAEIAEDELDLEDPFKQPFDVYQKSVEEIKEALALIIDLEQQRVSL